MKVTKEIIEKIEGEAQLELTWEEGKVAYSKVKFFSYRGIEEIIEGRHPMDALVLTPRVCGICGHAQLMACVHALENLYKNCGIELKITDKAKSIRDITLDAEIIQNHIKWLYFIILPILYKIEGKEFDKQKMFKALNTATIATKLIALFAGQWPHNSYMIPGGVVCDPTHVELYQAKSLIRKIISFFEEEIVKTDLKNCTEVDNFKEILDCGGVLSEVHNILINNNIAEVGKAHDRFIAFGENSIFKSAKSIRTITRAVHSRYIKEESLDFTYAKNVRYNGKFYEVGPLARAMVAKLPLAKSIHRVYKDSLLSRIVLKIMEIAYLSKHIEKRLDKIDLNENSYIKPKAKIETLEGKGEGFAEAARGSLYHSLEVKDEKIKKYNIITPTQWNLGNSTDDNELSTIQQALLGLEDENVISLVFRSFDECSVCTTH